MNRLTNVFASNVNHNVKLFRNHGGITGLGKFFRKILER